MPDTSLDGRLAVHDARPLHQTGSAKAAFPDSWGLPSVFPARSGISFQALKVRSRTVALGSDRNRRRVDRRPGIPVFPARPATCTLLPMFGYVRFASLAASVFLLGADTLVADVPGPSSRRTSWVISEVMYHPPTLTHGQELEFVEIYNAGLIAEDLAGHRLSGDWDFVFPTNTVVAAGGYVVVAPNPTDLMAAYGINGVLGGFTNRLANDQGLLRLRNPANAILLEVEYADTPPWPAAADGGGHSLVLSRPGFGERDPRAWTASAFVRGSPGQAEPSLPADAPVGMINELLTHTDDPQLDYVEILNPTDRCDRLFRLPSDRRSRESGLPHPFRRAAAAARTHCLRPESTGLRPGRRRRNAFPLHGRRSARP